MLKKECGAKCFLIDVQLVQGLFFCFIFQLAMAGRSGRKKESKERRGKDRSKSKESLKDELADLVSEHYDPAAEVDDDVNDKGLIAQCRGYVEDESVLVHGVTRKGKEW